VMDLFWTVAMRTVHGREHAGFPFYYWPHLLEV